jgi:hypothetical protein
LAVVLYVLSLLAASGCGGAGGTSASPTRLGPEAIFGAPGQLVSSPAATLDQLRHLGVDRVRLSIRWSALAPAAGSRVRPSGFDAGSPSAYPASGWSSYDAVVRDAKTRGIGVYVSLEGPAPLWATGTGPPRGGPYPQWEPSPSEFGSFVRAVATRYGGGYAPAGSSTLPRVGFWSVWNEPNYGIDLAPQAVDNSTLEVAPRMYRGLLDAAWAALGATGHGHDTILIGELAPRGQTIGDYPGNFAGMVPLRFLRALYCVDSSFRRLSGPTAAARGCPTDSAASASFAATHPALFKASGFAVHPYPPGGLPPTVVTPDEPDYADLASLPRLERALDSLQQTYASSTRFPIYSTEFGYQTKPPEKIARTTSPATAAYYLNWAEYVSWRDQRVRSYNQYLLRDAPQGNFASGLVFADGVPKPTYDAYRMPLYLPVSSTARGHRLELWGCVRPADYAEVDTHTRQRVEIQWHPDRTDAFRTIMTVVIADPYGYFDVRLPFRSSGAVRLAWTYPHGGPTIHSRTVGVTVT